MSYKKRLKNEEVDIDISKRPNLSLDSTVTIENINITSEVTENLEPPKIFEENSADQNSVDNNCEQEDNTIYPDKKSFNNIYNRGWALESLKAAKADFNRNKAKINITKEPKIFLKFTDKQIKTIFHEFKEKVISATPKLVILKDRKFGYELFIDGSNNRFWVNALEFQEPINLKSPKYKHVWQGNSFIGYGFVEFEDFINKVHNLMSKGKTGVNLFRDYVVDVNFDRNRFISSNHDFKLFTYEEYVKIEKWYVKNKINIMIKIAGQKDIEDLNDEIKMQNKDKSKTTALQVIQAKLLLPPRRCRFLVVMPCLNPKYKGKNFANPENKLYKIGFLFND
ncbi:hypothetical protein SSABA_v1c06220 [Spiroplasma sabaudiense Ar-1343]|uniref:Uncharacterized protein n=1 Tax=Spiroplasma sabaudiense Ar-1343 TaxID=1276257 RepID=W6AJW9_9MOLU|nr:hypothetical protein [Spiroplasma sabaudiense]AHI54024.1 hypothetical protein SSABA_v1c06220 [Spiroplasma sabaudiense Ar-1343]